MNRLKRFISISVAVCIIIVSLSGFAFAAGYDDSVLQFDSSGKLDIMFITDLHYSRSDNGNKTIAVMKKMLDSGKPDIVVFGGDNIISNDVTVFDDIIAPLTERGIPFTLVVGNHDDENGISRDDTFNYCTKFDNCLAYDADISLSGSGTHNLEIISSDGKSVAFNLCMFDSGASYFADGEKQYNGVHQDQLDWFKNQSESIKNKNNGVSAPTIVFQHIPACEMAKAVYFKSIFNIGSTLRFADGDAYTYIPRFSKIDGLIFEHCCPSYENYGEWDALKNDGNVLAVVTGHDHGNSFKTTYDGIDMLQSPNFSYCTYTNPITQGTRMITLDENGTYSTRVIHTYELALSDSDIPSITGTSAFEYCLYSLAGKLLLSLVKLTGLIGTK